MTNKVVKMMDAEIRLLDTSNILLFGDWLSRYAPMPGRYRIEIKNMDDENDRMQFDAVGIDISLVSSATRTIEDGLHYLWGTDNPSNPGQNLPNLSEPIESSSQDVGDVNTLVDDVFTHF